jgi:hypothetical protein
MSGVDEHRLASEKDPGRRKRDAFGMAAAMSLKQCRMPVNRGGDSLSTPPSQTSAEKPNPGNSMKTIVSPIPAESHKGSAREFEKPPIGGDLSVLPFFGMADFRIPPCTADLRQLPAESGAHSESLAY